MHSRQWKVNIASPPTDVLGGGRKLDTPEETHIDTGGTCKTPHNK